MPPQTDAANGRTSHTELAHAQCGRFVVVGVEEAARLLAHHRSDIAAQAAVVMLQVSLLAGLRCSARLQKMVLDFDELLADAWKAPGGDFSVTLASASPSLIRPYRRSRSF